MQVDAAVNRLDASVHRSAMDVHVPPPKSSVMDLAMGRPHKYEPRPEVNNAKQAAIAGNAPYITGGERH